jgi:uncharacterized protein (TIGR02246 family)
MQQAQEAIAQQRAEWIAVVNAGDVERYAALLARDAVWIPPGQPALQGREAIRAWLRPHFERFTYTFAIDAVCLRVAGDWAVEQACFTTEMVPKAEQHAREGRGAPLRHAGRYLVLWRHDPGSAWHIERYVDLTPATEASPAARQASEEAGAGGFVSKLWTASSTES